MNVRMDTSADAAHRSNVIVRISEAASMILIVIVQRAIHQYATTNNACANVSSVIFTNYFYTKQTQIFSNERISF